MHAGVAVHDARAVAQHKALCHLPQLLQAPAEAQREQHARRAPELTLFLPQRHARAVPPLQRAREDACARGPDVELWRRRGSCSSTAVTLRPERACFNAIRIFGARRTVLRLLSGAAARTGRDAAGRGQAVGGGGGGGGAGGRQRWVGGAALPPRVVFRRDEVRQLQARASLLLEL